MTKDTEKAFVILYSEYLRRRSFGTSKAQAVQFENSKIYAIDGFSDWDSQDIRYCIKELRQLGFVSVDILGNLELHKSGIEYMEDKPKEYFSRFTSAVKDILSLVAVFFSS